MKSVYIETSIISHACSRPGTTPAVVVLQEQARLWWQRERPKYKTVTSQFVIDEISVGDPAAVAKRIELASLLPVLTPTTDVETLAEAILSHALIPQKALLDALHVAMATVAQVDYLLTLNCKHISNAHTLPEI